MKTFLIVLGVIVVLVVLYFIWSDYSSRKVTDNMPTGGTGQGSNNPNNSALDWVTALLPVVVGSVDTILSKPKDEEEEEPMMGPPTYEDWIANLQQV